MGLNHDPANASGTPAYTYAYGYQNPSGLFRTVMAYPCPTGSCPRLMYFSNPGVSTLGAPTGTSSQNNASALNNTANTVANFRQSVSGSCSYTLTPTSSSVGAGGATSSFTVTSPDRVRVDRDEQPVVADDHQRRLGLRHRHGGLQRGRQHGRHEPQRDDHRRRQDVHRDAGGRGVQLRHLAHEPVGRIGRRLYSVSVTGTTGCTWTAVSNSSWITVSAGASGSGNGSVSLSVASNTSTSSRTGTVTIAGQTYTVTAGRRDLQLLALASIGVAVGSRRHRQLHRHDDDRVRVDGDEQPVVADDHQRRFGFRHRLGGLQRGRQHGRHQPQRDDHCRRATFTVTQAGRQLQLRAHAGVGVAVAAERCVAASASTAHTGCTWTASSNSVVAQRDQRRIGSGNGSIGYSVAANTAGPSRTATITAGGKSFTVTQAAASCSYSLAPTSASVASSGAASTVAMTAQTGCTWAATSNSASWLA